MISGELPLCGEHAELAGVAPGVDHGLGLLAYRAYCREMRWPPVDYAAAPAWETEVAAVFDVGFYQGVYPESLWRDVPRADRAPWVAAVRAVVDHACGLDTGAERV